MYNLGSIFLPYPNAEFYKIQPEYSQPGFFFDISTYYVPHRLGIWPR